MKALRPWYFVVANTAMLVWLVLLGTDVAIRTLERFWSDTPGLSESERRNYAHMAPADVDELLRVHRAVRYRHAPVVEFVHQATTSRFVNIDAHGIRANRKTSRDIGAMQDAVWFFGGSTAFGFGVADDETIPAQLEKMINRPVINLGVNGYSSVKENLLLDHYLRVGYRPYVAIFLDGINESCEPNLYEEEMKLLVEEVERGYRWNFGRPVTYAWPRFIRLLKQGLNIPTDPVTRQTLTCIRNGKSNELRTIHARTLAERDALCRLYNSDCQTMVQPFPGLHGRRDAFAARFLADGGQELREAFEHLEPTWRAAGATFLTDALDQHDTHGFIDELHYSAAASRLIAEAIAAHLERRPGPPLS
jgi:hypothetical protein